jgi:hypothetical protein
LRQVQEEKGEKFKTLEDEPKLGQHLFWIWQAFADLNYRRVPGMSSPLPLSYCEIEAYCRLKDIIYPSERSRLLRLIDELDRAWMANAHAEQEKNSKNPKGTPPPTHSPERGGGTRNRTKQVA